MGIPSQNVELDQIDIARLPVERFTEKDSVVAITAQALVSLYENRLGLSRHPLDTRSVRCHLLVLAFEGTEREGAAVSWLTASPIRLIHADGSANHTVSFPVEGEALCQQLAGTEFVSPRDSALAVFDTSQSGSAFVDIARSNGRSILIRKATNQSNLCFLGGANIADIDTPIHNPRDLDRYYDRVIPALMFLKAVFGSRAWHSTQAVARLIIDAPLLCEQYGYLNYAELHASMAQTDYATTIAFIPWNFWRTSKAAAERVVLKHQRLSLCIHGCDHTNQEFLDTDQALVAGKAKLALERMSRHTARTGIAAESIMVFPQGKVSTAAVAALERNGYLAAANSGCHPSNDETAEIALGDLLLPAVTQWSGFPIFPRSYPDNRFQCALSLFLGRPLLLVEHHQYFKHGYRATESCIEDLRRREPSLTFPPLGNILKRACLVRSSSRPVADVRFFTRTFEFAAEDKSVSLLRFQKHEPDPHRVWRVLANGRSVPFCTAGSLLTFEIEIPSVPCAFRIEVELIPAAPSPVLARTSLLYDCGVVLRRFSSEVRDRVLCRNETLLGISRAIVRKAGLTGEAPTPRNVLAGKAFPAPLVPVLKGKLAKDSSIRLNHTLRTDQPSSTDRT